MQETWVWSPGWEDPLEKWMATHSSILAWRNPWKEEPGGLQSMGSQRVWHEWVTNTHTHKEKNRRKPETGPSLLQAVCKWALGGRQERRSKKELLPWSSHLSGAAALCILWPQGPQGAPAEAKGRRRKETERRVGEEEVTDASPPRLGLEHGYITLRLCWPQLPTREWPPLSNLSNWDVTPCVDSGTQILMQSATFQKNPLFRTILQNRH